MWGKQHKLLGVVGGMGPLATQLFYRKLIEKTDASSDQEHIDMIIYNHASMPDRTEAIRSGQTEELFRLLLEDAKKLEESGVTTIAIPCNTSHLFVDRLQEELTVPIIHMVRETVAEVKGKPREIKRVGILATDGTLNSALYQKSCEEAGIIPVIPTESTQKLVMKIIYDGIKGGGPIDYNDFITIEGELSANGCQAAIMACTELSVFKEIYRLPDYYIDALDVLAERSITACGKPVKVGDR
jgi:aspartate racemase